MENIKKIEKLTETLNRVEENLKEEYLILKFLLEHSLDGYWDWNIQTNYEYLSPKLKEQLGYKDNEMENSPESWQKICDPQDLLECYELVKNCIIGNTNSFSKVLRFTHKKGHAIKIQCRGLIVARNSFGQGERMVGTHRIIND